MKKLLYILPAALILGFVAKNANLSLNLEKGKTYSQVSHIESNIVQNMQGQEVAISTVIDGTISTEVTEDGKDVDKLSMWYETLSSTSTSPFGSVTFSSDTNEMTTVDQVSSIFAQIMDKKFTVNVNNQGQISEVSGISEMMDTAIDNSGSHSEMEQDQIKQQLAANFGNEALKGNLESTLAIFPEGKVKIGDSWNNEIVTAGELPTISKNTYTLESLDDDKATIKLSAEVNTDPNNSSKDVQGMSAQYFLEGTRSGTLIIDIKSGWLLDGKFTDKIAGSINISPNAQVPEGMSIPLTVTTNSIITGTVQ